jgi:hypothetical protein
MANTMPNQGFLQIYLITKLSNIISGTINVNLHDQYFPTTSIKTTPIVKWLTITELVSNNFDTTVNTHLNQAQPLIEPNTPAVAIPLATGIEPQQVVTIPDYSSLVNFLPIVNKEPVSNTGVPGWESAGTSTALLSLSLKDLAHYKERINSFENDVYITQNDYITYNLKDFIPVSSFNNKESILLAEMPIAIQNEIGLRFMLFNSYVKESANKLYFYKDRILSLFRDNSNLHPIFYKACRNSNIPDSLYTKFPNRLHLEFNKVFIENDNLEPVIYEVALSARDNSISKDIIFYYNLTNSNILDIEISPDIRNIILSVNICRTEAVFKPEILQNPDYNYLQNHTIKYNSTYNYYYYQTFTSSHERKIDPLFLDFIITNKKRHYFNVSIDKTSSIIVKEIDKSFRFNNSIFYGFGATSNAPVQSISNQVYIFDETYDRKYNKTNIGSDYKKLFMNAPGFLFPDAPDSNTIFNISITSGYNHCKELEKFLLYDKEGNIDNSDLAYENYKPLINFIDTAVISAADLNQILMVFFYKINRNNKRAEPYILQTTSLLDINLNQGHFNKIYNFKEFFVTQFGTYLRLTENIVPFSGGFKSYIKQFIQTKAFNVTFITEELSQFIIQLNILYSANFNLVSITPISQDNGMFVKVTLQIVISINNELLSLDVVAN